MGLITNNLDDIGHALLDMGGRVEVPTWQALDVRDKPQGATIELENTLLHAWDIPSDIKQLMADVEPNLPWAENQFLERVSGKPLNPGETYKEWPWYHGNVETHKGQGQFSHTYMERYWGREAPAISRGGARRFDYKGARGDLYDVVKLLAKEPTTRQAYLPVFWPEDTGAVHGERVPCSLGYLFLLREGRLNINYYIRSCDYLRHFRDDVYMTARLCQWVVSQLVPRYGRDDVPVSKEDFKGDPKSATAQWAGVTPGRLTMHIGSLHVFEGDLPQLRRKYGRAA